MQLSPRWAVNTHVRKLKDMKKDINNMNQNQDHLTEQQLNELENDAVWTLLDNAELDNAEKGSSTEANPMFARNVMREIRVNHTGATASSTSFWQRLMAPKFNKIALTLGATVACAALVISQMTAEDQPDAPSSLATETETNDNVDQLDDISIEDIVTFVEAEEDNFTEEMLDLASQDPFYISEEEIELAMQL